MKKVSLINMSLAGAAVALIIITDIATGQGPPALNSYLANAPIRGFGRGPPMQQGPLMVNPYPPRPDFEEPISRGPYEKEPSGKEEKEELKKEAKLLHHDSHHEFKEEKGYGKESGYKSTPAPGMLSSFSKSMSDAWSSLSSLGRSN